MPALYVRSRWKTAAAGRSLCPLNLARIGPVTHLPYSGYSENWEMRKLDGTKWGSFISSGALRWSGGRVFTPASAW